jgi:hypothetical protein
MMPLFGYAPNDGHFSHGLVKQDTVPAKEIELACQRRNKLIADPRRHSAGTQAP